MGDNRCVTNSRRKTTFSLKPAHDPSDPWAEFKEHPAIRALRERQELAEAEQHAASEAARERFRLRQERIEDRRECRELIEKARRGRAEARLHQEKIRAERKAQDEADAKRRWQDLLRFAVEGLGLEPASDWSKDTLPAIIKAERLRQEALAASRERKQGRERERLEYLVDRFEDIPHVARMGFHDRKSDFLPGDARSFNRLWQSQGRHRIELAREMAEHLGQSFSRPRRSGRGQRNPQKQPRTWQAAAGKGWRRSSIRNPRSGKWIDIGAYEPI